MTISRNVLDRRRSVVSLGLAVAAVGGSAIALTLAMPAAAASCSQIDVSFARGTGEAQGPGSLGGPFLSAITAALPGSSVSSYNVVYDANTSQSSAAPGSTDLTNHITSVAAACPSTQFILGGYSQGATVVDKSLGITTGSGTGTAIPSALSGRIAAAVVFGNPLGLQGKTIATASPTYGSRSKDYCNTGDPVCGNGSNVGAHLTYGSNGSVADGGRFAAGLVSATPTPTPPTTTPPTTTPPTCVRASTRDQVAAGRASDRFNYAFAIGTQDRLGRDDSFTFVSLKQNSATSWSRVVRC